MYSVVCTSAGLNAACMHVFFLNISRRAAVFIALEGESIQTRSFRSPNRKNREKKEGAPGLQKKEKGGHSPRDKENQPGSKGLPLV
jgi:hypothetical protein